MIRPLAISTVLLLAAAQTTANGRDGYERSVVSLAITAQSWDGVRPWTKRTPITRRGSAVVVATPRGPLILTTAQMLAEATLIRLETFGRDADSTPQIVLVDPTVDLALLSADEKGLRGIEPVALAEQTPTDRVLSTARWLDQQLETAASRIQRFQVEEGYFGGVEHVYLLAQTDISGGGWAEPVFDGNRLVGLTANQDERQRARIIPAEILSAFVRRASDPGGYAGFPGWSVAWQDKADPATSAYFGQSGPPRGVLIRQVPCGGTGSGVLQPRDILLEVEGHPIQGDGTYVHPRLGQVHFTHILQEGHEVGDTVRVRVLRDRQPVELGLTLHKAALDVDLVPAYLFGQPPAYLVAGGLIFRELDVEYLRLWGGDWRREAPAELVTRYTIDRFEQAPHRRRIILLSSVLPAPYNIGYQDLRNLAVESINGRPIDSIPDVAEALGQPKAGFHVIRFGPTAPRREIVLDASRLESAGREILDHYDIPEAYRPPAELTPLAGDCPAEPAPAAP